MPVMYIATDKNEIIEAFLIAETNPVRIKQKYPNAKVLRSDFAVLPTEAKSLLRVFNNRIVPKISATMSLNKEEIIADGEDEITIDIELQNVQPDETIEHVTVDVDGAKMLVKINNGTGRLIFSTRAKGLHIITIEDEKIHCCPKAVMGK